MKRRLPDPWLLVAALTFLGLLFVALLGGRVAPHEAIYFVVEHGTDPRPYDPGVVFPFGSDVLGRDIFSLVLAGAQTTLTIVLLGGAARVLAGVLAAAISGWWRPTQVAVESVAELVSAIPATLVALVLVKVFVKSDTSVLVFVGALLVMGWAGPYRVIRAEVDRLAHAPFTQGAVAMGVGRWRLFLRHHLPHLVPVIAMNLSQQIVASLVLVAELGVLGTFVGGTRVINVEESMSLVRTGIPTTAPINDQPEWGGLLAGSRSVQALWTTRWLVFVPGLAFAITAVSVALIGFALARRYARRDMIQDLRGAGSAALVLATLALFVTSAVVPERYTAARDWAAAVKAELRPVSEVEASFGSAGLRPLAGGFAVRRDVSGIMQTKAGSVRVGEVTLTEPWPREEDPLPGIPKPHLRAFVSADTGGGAVEAPLVYVGRGIAPSDFPPEARNPFSIVDDLGTLVREYADDYAGVDVRGKVVLLVRFLGVRGPPRFPTAYSVGPSGNEQISKAIRRGAAAVIFVDPALHLYTDEQRPFTTRSGELTAGLSPFTRLERTFPPVQAVGVPVMLVDLVAAQQLVAGTGVDLSAFNRHDDRTPDKYRVSPARQLAVHARVEVPLEHRTGNVTSYVGESDAVPGDIGRILLWTERRPGPDSARDVLAATARALGPRHAAMIFVELDPAVDAIANRKAVREVLKDRRITLVIVLDRIQGTALKFTTPYGHLIPALDHYAEKVGARHEVTRTTSRIGAIEDVTPFPELPTVLITGTGGRGDLRLDAAAVVGYLAGRHRLGAEELPR